METGIKDMKRAKKVVDDVERPFKYVLTTFFQESHVVLMMMMKNFVVACGFAFKRFLSASKIKFYS